MEQELQDKLFKKYPKIFEQRKLPMTQTCMCWGLECGKGWYQLLDCLCSSLQWDTERNGYPQVVFTQVKEKFGTLRAYYNWKYDDKKKPLKERFKYWIYNFLRYLMRKFCRELYDMERKYAHQEGKISLAEHLTQTICERCGAMEGTQQTKGWIVTLCPPCMKAYKKERGIK